MGNGLLKRGVSVAPFSLECLTLLFSIWGHYRCELSVILLGSTPQCPLPFLPPLLLSVHLASLASLLSPHIPLWLPYLIFIFATLFNLAFDVHALSHGHDSVTLSLSSARGLHCFQPPLLPPPPTILPLCSSSFTVSPLPPFPLSPWLIR